MPWIGSVSEDPELKHAGARDDSLDLVHLRLLDLGQDDLELVEAELANGHLLLAAWIHPATDRRDEFVHRDLHLFGRDLVLDREGRGRGLPGNLLHRGPVKRSFLHRCQKCLAGGRIGGLELDRQPAIPLPLDRGGGAVLGCQHPFDHGHTIVDPVLPLLARRDLVHKDQSALEVDAQPRRPAHPADRASGGQGDEHGGNPPPHVGHTEVLRHHPGDHRRHDEHGKCDQPAGAGGLPPRHGGERSDAGFGGDESQKADDAREVHGALWRTLGKSGETFFGKVGGKSGGIAEQQGDRAATSGRGFGTVAAGRNHLRDARERDRKLHVG